MELIQKMVCVLATTCKMEFAKWRYADSKQCKTTMYTRFFTQVMVGCKECYNLTSMTRISSDAQFKNVELLSTKNTTMFPARRSRLIPLQRNETTMLSLCQIKVLVLKVCVHIPQLSPEHKNAYDSGSGMWMQASRAWKRCEFYKIGIKLTAGVTQKLIFGVGSNTMLD